MTRKELLEKIESLQEYDPGYVDEMKKAWGEELENAEGRLIVDILSYLVGRRLTAQLRKGK